LASTGFNMLRDVEIGATMIIGGWALNRWASRLPEPAPGFVTGESPSAATDDEAH
jgi:hypothetical protein